MVEALRPNRGGFLRPFGAAIFIRDYLAGKGPKYGAEQIDPRRGAPQTDVHAAYKAALHMAIAEDSAALDAEEAIRRGKPMTPEEVEERARYYLGRIPSKLTRMRYSSFTNYFARLIKLGWVEHTGQTEPSTPQENWPQARPRVFYRLTAKGRAAPISEWSDPLWPLYHYPRSIRSAKKKRIYYTPPRQRGRQRK